MELWTIKELKTWLRKFDNPNSSMNYFLGGASDGQIKEAKRILNNKTTK